MLKTVPSLLRGLVLAAAAVIFCWPLTVASGVVTAAAGALAGALVADRLFFRAPALRLASVLAAAFLALVAGTWLARALAASPLVAGALGPVAAIHLSEAARWLSLAAPVALALRFTARRRPILALLEVLAVALAVATGFAAHRDGMVHRPLAIGDWAWSRGIDPVLVFLVLGGLAALLLAALLVSEERRRRLPLHFAGLILVALALVLIIRVAGLPRPQGGGDLGLTGDPEAEEGGEGGGGGRGDPDDQLGDLEFKDEYASGGSEAPVAVVLLHDDYSPPSGVYYFRQSAFSQYNGRRLVQALSGDVDRDVLRRFPARPVDVPAAPPVSRGRSPLKTSMALLIDHVRPFALDSPARVRPMKNPNPLRFQRAFEVTSHVQTLPYTELIGRLPGDEEWTGEQWQHYTEAPADRRYAELADAVMERLREDYRSDPLAQTLAIKSYLDENGIYSRKSRHADTGDPAASFLFGDLTGYCVHFAHAATYLFRSRGLPSRVAAGYAVAESSRGTGSTIMIRGADAHAWPEVYLQGVGWVVVDLSPEQTLDDPASAADPDLQRMLGEMMRQQWQDEELLEEPPPMSLAEIGRWLFLALLALLGFFYAIKLYRAQAPRFAGAGALYRVGYRAALDRLADIGARRRYGESRERFAERTAALSPAFAALTEEHLRGALGSRRRSDAAGLRRLAGEVGRELRARVPAWRRLLGLINPVAWMMAR